MNELTRPLELIEAEINFYKAQTANGIIEIGKRLIEAKEQVAHGEWSIWLKEKVDFSQETARRFMKIAEEFSNSTALGNLPVTKIYALLDVPSDQREEFAQQHDLEEMTTREVEKAVKEWKQRFDNAKRIADEKEEEAKRLQAALDKKRIELRDETGKLQLLQQKNKDLQVELKKATESGDTAQIEKLRQRLKESDEAWRAAEARIDELEEQLKRKPIEVQAVETIEKVPDEIQKELDELRRKAAQPVNDAAQRYKVYFDIIVDNYKKLLSTLSELQQTDPAGYVKYRKATAGMLVKLGEQVKDTAEPAGHCGECVHADMDGVTDEQLDDDKTLCTVTGQIVDFMHTCDKYKSFRGE
jgi:chromosome segregation ATPase